jgi:hypothetical protein
VIATPIIMFGLPSVSILIRASLIVLVLAVLLVGLESLQGIRSVVLNAQGVRFRYLVHERRALWSEILPPRSDPYAGRRGGIFIFRTFTPKGDGRTAGYFVTREQARAILTHPSCSAKEIEPGVRAYLGL